MTKDTFDRVLTSRPVNKTAAMATRKGVHFETPPGKYGGTPWGKAPPSIRAIDKTAAGYIEDFTGRVIGRLLVLGYHGSGPKGALWVTRCACGDYGKLRSKYLRAVDPKRAMCPSCDYVEYLKYGEAHK